jgi:hypothetical protein
MSYYARDPMRHENLDVAKLAQLFDSWPDSIEYQISECNMVKNHIVVYLVLMINAFLNIYASL